MDDNSSDNVSSGGGDNFVSPPLADAQLVSNDVPPATVVLPPSPPEMPKEELPKQNIARSAVLAAVFLLIAVSSVAGYYWVQKGGLGLQKKAEGACFPDNESNPCHDRMPGWSTCDTDGTRWGCDAACNKWEATPGIGSGQYTDPWCEGTTKKECTSGGIVARACNSQECGAPAECSGKQEGKSFCSGVGGNDGIVGILNCTCDPITYVCQVNHSLFTSETACKASTETNEYQDYRYITVEPGHTGTCSHYGPSGVPKCFITQVDIEHNTLEGGGCWDKLWQCTECGVVTPSPSPTATVAPSPTPTGTLIPTATPTSTLIPSPMPTNTIRPTQTPTPTTPPGVPTPTPQPTMAPACNFVKVYKVNSDGSKTEVSSGALLNAGDRLYIEASFKLNRNVQKAMAVIRRNGVVVKEEPAPFNVDPPTNLETDYRITFYYDITQTGNYEVGAFYYYGAAWH